MQASFLLVTAASIVAIIVFALLYFYLATREQAMRNMREKVEIAEMIYNYAEERTGTFAQSLAEDSALQVLLDLDIRNKLSDYVRSTVEREKVYQIIVFDEKLKTFADVSLENSPVAREEELIPPAKNPFLADVLAGKSVTGTEAILVGSGKKILSISSTHPVKRDGRVVGGVLVRYILDGNKSFVEDIGKKVHADAAVFAENAVVADTAYFNPGPEFTISRPFARVRMWFGGTLAEYRPIRDIGGIAVGALAVQDSADRFMATFVNALLIFLGIAAVAILLSVVSVSLIARGILVPLNQLLFGVNRIAEGDLAFEITVDLKDEIGKLSHAFDDMRRSLKEKISTIEEMNENLEGKVKERTSTIETLMQSMKKYLPSQLFEAIVRGSRSDDLNSHYRRKLTVFFSDVVGFTSTTESMEAEDLSTLLNNYLDNMAKIALKWGGTIDKFVGDAIMVFFGDPEYTNDTDHALRAVRMSMEMLVKMQELRTEWLNRGIQQPLHVRVGINSGYCTVGNFGSENRMDYTIIGSNVNLASRLETSAEPDTILISYDTYSLIKNDINCVYAGEIQPKGFSHPVRTYKVVGEIAKKEIPEWIELKPTGISFRESVIDPTGLRQEERTALVRSLDMALRYAQGSIKYVFDDASKTWKLVRLASAPAQVQNSASPKKPKPSSS
jgi:class 3 adenylate cyclase/HAMP domain-containing protein